MTPISSTEGSESGEKDRRDPQEEGMQLRWARGSFYTVLGLLEFSIVPVLSLVITPFVFGRLGAESYGLWVTCNALILAVSLISLGVPDWIVVKVGRARVREDWNRHVSALWGDALCLAVGLGLVLILVMPFVFLVTLQSAGSDARIALLMPAMLTIAASVFRLFEIILLGIVRGLDRWDLAGAVGVSAKVCNLANLASMAYMKASISSILIGQAGIGLATVGAYHFLLRRQVGSAPNLSKGFLARAREYVGEARPFWAHVSVSAIVHSLDRVLVSATFGLRVASGYAVCAQLTQQMYTLSWSGANWLVPSVARWSVAGAFRAIRRILVWGWIIGCAFALIAVVCAIVFGCWFLTAWMGSAFSAEWYGLLVSLSVAMGLFALPIVPWYVVQGLGMARLLVPYYLTGAAVGGVAFLFLQRAFGVEAVVTARGIVALVLGLGVTKALPRWKALKLALSADVGPP